jgi:hypothetical protein
MIVDKINVSPSRNLSSYVELRLEGLMDVK